eukprot:gene10720-3340_t
MDAIQKLLGFKQSDTDYKRYSAAKLHPDFIETSKDKCFLFFNWLWIFISTMFIIIAAVLGISILALPVKSGESGISPVIFNIIVCGGFQLFLINYMIELLLRTDALMKRDCSLLIAYVLSSGSAIAQLANIVSPGQQITIPVQAIIPFFVVIFTLLVIYTFDFLRSIISVLTGIKVGFLMVVIFGVGAVASQIDFVFKEQWQYVGRPFLISTIALGNSVSALTIIYGKFKPTKSNVRALRGGAMTGIAVCSILCVLWTYFVLKSVPQDHVDNNYPSLRQAEQQGDICTIPLVKIIHTRFPQFQWVAIFITLFIAFSLTISYIIVTASLKQQIDGYIKAFVHYWKIPGSTINHWFGQYSRAADILEFCIYVFIFLSITLISITNTSGLFVVLERVSSFTLNVISGLFICCLFFIARKKKFDVPIPLSMHWISGELMACLCMVYFTIAILWDVLTGIVGIWINPLPF